MKNLTLSIPEELLERLKERAHAEQRSMNAFVRNALESSLENGPKYSTEERRRRLREVLNRANPTKAWKWNRDELYQDD